MIRFGIDFGGVIVRRREPGQDTSLELGDGDDIAHPGMFRAVGEIVSLCDGRVWIVSKARPRMQARTLDWLASVDFFERTGLCADHVRFCLERDEKEAICRELDISHFVDDRIHVMQILRHAVPNLFLFGENGHEKFCPPWALFVSDWADILEAISRSEAEGS